MKYLLDTDIVSYLQGNSQPYADRILSRMSQHDPDDVGISVVTFHEQSRGAHSYINRATTSEQVVNGYALLDDIIQAFVEYPTVSFDALAAAEFDRLYAQKLRVKTMDLRIASIALSRGLTVVTNNLRDFQRVPGLVAEDWSA